MDRMKETGRIVFMLMIVIFYYWCMGVNINIIPYESADPDLPHAVTVDGRTVSLLSGDNNLYNALGNNFDTLHGCLINGDAKLIGFADPYLIYDIYDLDKSGKYPDACRIYNGITTASTKAELENAFGEDCIKTDDYFAEIFIDDEEIDYEKIDISAFDEDDIPDTWFETIAANYPQAKFITILVCSHYDNSPNDITFFVYDSEYKNI